MSIGENIRAARKAAKMSQQELAESIGANRVTISSYETDKYSPSLSALSSIARALGTTSAQLSGEDLLVMDADNLLPIPKMNKVPLVGTIACGTPVLAQENIEDWVNMPEGVHADFALRCKGDSMINARIHDGDIVFIRRQDDVLDRQIAAVLIDDEATLKRVQHMANGAILLQAENPAYPPLLCGGPNETREIRIIGLATHFLSVAK